MADKCPYCYRPIGTHSHDPILLPNGSPNYWINSNTLSVESDIAKRFYKGTYQVEENDFIELRNELENLEIANSVTPLTIWTPLNITGKFQITGFHIKEMRDSIEKLLIIFALTKTDYFNYDENLNHIINPNGDQVEWTDPITDATDLVHFQVRAIHIEELRHYINAVIMWEETWDSVVGNPSNEQHNLLLSGGSTYILTWFALFTQANHWWDGNLYNELRLTGASTPHSDWYSKADSYYDILGTGDKSIQLKSDIEVSVRNTGSGSTALANVNDNHLIASIFSSIDEVGLNVTPGLYLKTIGSKNETLTGETPTTYVSSLLLTIRVRDSIYNYYNVEYITGAASFPGAHSIVVDWTTMDRNFYEDLRVLLLNYYSIDITLDTYTVTLIKVGYTHSLYRTSPGDIGIQHKTSSSLLWSNSYIGFHK
jgi:hypothetical protein